MNGLEYFILITTLAGLVFLAINWPLNVPEPETPDPMEAACNAGTIGTWIFGLLFL